MILKSKLSTPCFCNHHYLVWHHESLPYSRNIGIGLSKYAHIFISIHFIDLFLYIFADLFLSLDAKLCDMPWIRSLGTGGAEQSTFILKGSLYYEWNPRTGKQGETAPVGSAASTWHCHRGKKQKAAPSDELHKKVPGVVACAVSQLILASYTSFLLLC